MLKRTADGGIKFHHEGAREHDGGPHSGSLSQSPQRQLHSRHGAANRGIRTDSATRDRVEELADKCSEGRLTAEERAEYEAAVKSIHLISIL
ncbi:MAG: hypothetical protein ACJ8F7_22565 [Gemmataceae bacterium]